MHCMQWRPTTRWLSHLFSFLPQCGPQLWQAMPVPHQHDEFCSRHTTLPNQTNDRSKNNGWHCVHGKIMCFSMRFCVVHQPDLAVRDRMVHLHRPTVNNDE